MTLRNSMKNTILKVTKDNKHYTLSPWPLHGTRFALSNEDEEAMGLNEEALFDILDKYFKKEF